MNFVMPVFSAAVPEIFMLCMVSTILLVDVFLKEDHKIITYILTQFALGATFLWVAMQYHDYPHPIVTFSGHYIVDRLAVLTKLFILLTSFFAFVYARQYIKELHIPRGEYYILV